MHPHPMRGLAALLLAGACVAPKRPSAVALLASDQVAVSGVVMDLTSSQRLQQVGVELSLVGHQNDPLTSAVTEEKGEFSFVVPVGKYMLRVVRPGYQEVRLAIDATKPLERPLDVRLRPLAGGLRCTPSRYHTLECP